MGADIFSVNREKVYIVFKKTLVVSVVAVSALFLVGCSNGATPTDTSKTATEYPDATTWAPETTAAPKEKEVWDAASMNGTTINVIRGAMPKVTLAGNVQDWVGSSSEKSVAQFNPGTIASEPFITTINPGTTLITLTNKVTGEVVSFTVVVADGSTAVDADSVGDNPAPKVELPPVPAH